MSNANWPPADIGPQEFFEQWLPAEIARLRAQNPSAPAPDLTTAVTLSGEGGGSWTITSKAGELQVSPSTDGGANVTVELTVGDFRALLDPDAGLVPADTSGAELLVAGPMAEKLATQAKNTKGKLSFQITGYEGRDWFAHVSLGGASAPAATIKLGYDVYQKLLDQSLPAPQAYFNGQILMEGDSAFAMQLAMAMMVG